MTSIAQKLQLDLLAQTRKVLGLIDRQNRPLLALLLFTTVLSSVLEVLSITAVLPFLQLMLEPTRSRSMEWLRPTFGDMDSRQVFLWVCVGIIIIFTLKIAVTLFSNWLKLYIQARVYHRLSTRLLNSYIDSPISFHLKHGSSELLRNLTSYVAQATQYGFLGLVDLTSDALLAVGIFSALVWVEPLISFLAVISLMLLAGTYIVAGQPYLIRLGKAYKDASGRMFQHATEALVGIKTLKALGVEEHFSNVYARCTYEFCDVMRRYSFIGFVPRQMLEFVAVLALMGLIMWAVLGSRDPASLIPVLAVFAAATYRLMPAIVRMTTTLQSLRFGHEAIETVYSGIRQSRDVVPARRDRSQKASPDALTLSDVTFYYGGTNKPALDGVSLRVRKGEAVAFVGSSGAGKTTLADLILGFHTPDSGSVIFEGGQASLAPDVVGPIGYVPQDPFLINDSIRRNIALGVADADIDEARFNRAVRSASLEEFIAGLPQGADTVVGDRGVRLSGGQRQRVGIARAMYVDPEVLIFDEATSSIDVTTEAEITEAISRLHGTKTLLVIAHRLSTVRECDRIFFLEEGRVVDAGSFDELVTKNKKFAAMVNEMDRTAKMGSVA